MAVGIYRFTVLSFFTVLVLPLILQMCANNPYIYPETDAAPLQPFPCQFLISIPRLISPSKTISVNDLTDDLNSLCKKTRNSSLIAQSLPNSVINRDSCSCFERFSFIFLATFYWVNWTQQLTKSSCTFTTVLKMLF